MPIVRHVKRSEPFKRVAFDIVGPLTRSKQGYKYILTTICLASRYPDAIPLRDISAETVADGILEVWSRTGVPKEVFTDQGSQFTSKLMAQLCTKLKVKQVRTSPYHPQSNGALERFHGTLVPMVKKCMSDSLSWPQQLKFCLFALRAMPHKLSGFTPFEVVYGLNLHTPLELLFDSWLDSSMEPQSLCKWMVKFEERTKIVRKTMRERIKEVKENERVKEEVKKLRVFKEGDKVLFRVPGLGNKLSLAWQGPFVVKRRVGDVNYEVKQGRNG